MKNKIKFTFALIAILIMISSFCFAEGQTQTPIEPRITEAEEINITDENSVSTNIEEETINQKPEIYKGDLYIFEDNVNMDKLVDGNVYIIGKNVTITGQIAGNLFVIADNLIIGDETSSYNGYVFYNIYALANKATLYRSCYDLYIAGNDITIEDSFYLYRDLKIGATNANIYATIGRNLDANVKNLNLKKDDNSYATIGSNLNYSSSNQIDDETLNISVMKESNFTQKRFSSINFTKIKTFSLIIISIFLLIIIIILALIIKLIIYIINKITKNNKNK